MGEHSPNLVTLLAAFLCIDRKMQIRYFFFLCKVSLLPKGGSRIFFFLL
jgi:hypothetical protein